MDFICTLPWTHSEEIHIDYYNSPVDLVGKVTEDSGLDKRNVHDVSLVSGSTRIPTMQKVFWEFLSGEKPNRSTNIDEVVAYGATVRAAILTDEDPSQVQYLSLLGATPLFLRPDARDVCWQPA